VNTTAWLTTLSAILGFLTIALGLVVRWVVANKDTIVALIVAVRDIHGIIKATPILPDPKPLPPAIQPGGVK
jgi:hypothetical protein